MAVTVAQLVSNQRVRTVLESVFDFSVEEEQEAPSWFRIDGPDSFRPIATEGAGGVFMLGNTSGSILYVTSEGGAGIVASSLTEFLQLVLAHPYWADLLKFSGGGSIREMERAAPHLERELLEEHPDIEQQRKVLTQELSLEQATAPIARLHHAVASLGADSRVIDPDGSVYEPLFGSFTVTGNPAWREHPPG